MLPLPARAAERGNMLFIILIAVALIGLLTAAITNSNYSDGGGIDEETLAIRASEIQRYASELERAVGFVMQKGYSETEIRFAHPEADADYGDLSADTDKTDQIFHRSGGGATYRMPPVGVSADPWEFYGATAVPNVGTAKADLVAVLPNISKALCERLNKLNETNGEKPIPTDDGADLATALAAGDCVYQGDLARFNDTIQFYDTPDTMNEATFTQYTTPSGDTARPAPEGCVQCALGGTPSYNFYHVLLAR